ncbi:MAG: hypothetical protein M3N53_09615 [Actinomycetota bacterium]|nr:hypothetical protein [Actinomycetota bacterium]
MRSKYILMALVMALVASSMTPALAGKKKPKPYKSPDGVIAVAHTMLFASTGEVNSVTANEFEARCEIPATNGLDAYVYEVPKAYQKIQSNILATADSQVGHDLYAFFYDKDCVLLPTSVQAGAVVGEKNDAEGIMPAGVSWVLLANFAGDPAVVRFELKP